MIKTTVIVAFYNNINYLKLVLAGFEVQTEKDFELIIADDGSDHEVVDKIKDEIKQSSLNIKFVRHEKDGFRKNKILNEAVKKSDSDYLIFIDGDCIPHKSFVEEHLLNSLEKTTLTGRRINLSEKFTARLTPEKIKDGFITKNFIKLIIDGIVGESNYVEKGFYFKNNFLRKIVNKKPRGLIGCNFSLFKKDLIEINGFDERYQAPSIGEDSDVQFRLELNGVKVKPINNIAVQYHLYHKLQNRPPENLLLFNQVKKEQTVYTPFGIIKAQQK